MRRVWVSGILAALVLGAALRLSPLRAEFWLDEILSWQLAQQAGTPLGTFAVRHDNNHHLNTAWLTLWPGAWPAVTYRLHSLVAGLLGVLAAAMTARRGGAADAVIAALLFATNYWLVLASAEARGYAAAVLFALTAFTSLQRYLDERRWRWLFAFWLSNIYGFLAHLSFVHAYLGFVVWSLRRFARERRRPGDELRNLLVCHAGVLLFFAPFYLFCVRGMEVAGAPPAPLLPVIARLITLGLGGPDVWPWGIFWVVAFAAVFAAGVWRLYREGSDVWVFYAICVVASPALFLARRPPFVFERYFLIPFAFFLLLAAGVFGSLWRRGGVGRAGAVVGLLLITAGNAWHVAEFSRAGRGEFAEALAWVLAQDGAGRVTVTGDNDFRVRAYVEFYGRYEPAREVEYVPDGAEWLFVHRLDDRHPPEEEVRDAAGAMYRLVRAYPSRGRGAWGWFVYRRACPPG
jgi:uncharacterized membrane protein